MTTRTTYLLHHGAPSNSYYALYIGIPRVRVTLVKDGADPTRRVLLYESPDEPVFNFCRFGVERRLKICLPLGSYCRLEMTAIPIEQPAPTLHVYQECPDGQEAQCDVDGLVQVGRGGCR